MSSSPAVTRVDEFIASLWSALPPDRIAEGGLARYEVDGLQPDIAVAPASVEELQTVLGEASEAGLAVIPFGGGDHMAAANLPAAYEVALSLSRLDQGIEHEPADLTVTVDAGVRLATLQVRLAEKAQHLPLDPPCGDAATAGGIIAANAFGPLRHAFGTARDWLIGIRVAHADGSGSKAGGRVVKNVAGYDMPKLYAGSLGTLGVITSATFKLAPLPAAQATVAAGFHAAAPACTLALAAHDAGLALHALELLSPTAAFAVTGEHRWTVLARLGGRQGAVDRSLRDLHALAQEVSASFEILDSNQVWPAWRRSFRPSLLSLRAGVRPSRVAETIEVLDRQFIGAAPLLSATVSAGVIRAQLEPTREKRAGALTERATEVVERAGGYLTVDAAPPALKRQIDVFGAPRPDFAIMRRLKEEFDPKRTLSPGRFAGRL
ncbi:MAG: FAD-binding oxidoreductase [Dehalococcoidia bacterium]